MEDRKITDWSFPFARSLCDFPVPVGPYWDAAILAAGAQLGCPVVYSEDLSDGQDYDGVRVENPFRDIPASAPQP